MFNVSLQWVLRRCNSFDCVTRRVVISPSGVHGVDPTVRYFSINLVVARAPDDLASRFFIPFPNHRPTLSERKKMSKDKNWKKKKLKNKIKELKNEFQQAFFFAAVARSYSLKEAGNALFKPGVSLLHRHSYRLPRLPPSRRYNVLNAVCCRLYMWHTSIFCLNGTALALPCIIAYTLRSSVFPHNLSALIVLLVIVQSSRLRVLERPPVFRPPRPLRSFSSHRHHRLQGGWVPGCCLFIVLPYSKLADSRLLRWYANRALQIPLEPRCWSFLSLHHCGR